MAWESAPWMIGLGVEHSVEVARLLAHMAASNREGVVSPGDCKVQPLNTPGTKVRIAPGAVALKNRYPGGQQQAYVGRNTTEHEVSVTATGSGGGRSDLVVARVLDPQYEGQEPEDPNDFHYTRTEIIEDIPSNTKRFDELGLDYPAIELARIDLPASTGTVESEHITDLRRLLRPEKERHLIAYNLKFTDGPNDGEGDIRLTNAHAQAFPRLADIQNSDQWYVEIPEWAQRARVVCMWGGVYLGSGDAHGEMWGHIGDFPESGDPLNNPPEWIRTEAARWNSPDADNPTRETWLCAHDMSIPAAMRGRRVPAYLRANIASGSGNARPKLDGRSSIVLDIEFYETTV